jgi:CBS domain-containing protein
MIVDSLMHRPVVVIDASASVREASALMERHRVGCLVATHGRDKPVGILTERDIVFRVVSTGRDPAATRVSDAMSAPLITIEPSDSVESAAEKMKQHRIKRLVILRDGLASGVISVTDIAYASPDASRAMMDAWVKQRWED